MPIFGMPRRRAPSPERFGEVRPKRYGALETWPTVSIARYIVDNPADWGKDRFKP
jgi:hypothetical protein